MKLEKKNINLKQNSCVVVYTYVCFFFIYIYVKLDFKSNLLDARRDVFILFFSNFLTHTFFIHVARATPNAFIIILIYAISLFVHDAKNNIIIIIFRLYIIVKSIDVFFIFYNKKINK